MASISVTNTFANSTTADATQVNQNFTDIINGTSDGTKDFSISALTVGGTLTANGNVTLGNSSSDDLTITASLASSLAIKTTNSYNVGSATLGLGILYFGNGTNSNTVALRGGVTSSSYTLTLPTTAGTARYRLETDGAGATSWVKSFTSSSDIRNASLAVSLAGNAMTIALKGADGNDPSATNPVTIVFRSATATTGTLSEVVVTSALSVTVSSGSTLGTTSAVESKINIYAINNAGTVELAVANLGAVSVDGRLSTTAEGGGGAADSATVFYSTTARSNVACKLLGAVVSTQATAGTWATAITSIITAGCGMVLTSGNSDTVTYTPTVSNLGTGSTSTNVGWYSYLGDQVNVRINFVKDGSNGSGTSLVNWTMPSGATINGSKATSVGGVYFVGFAHVFDIVTLSSGVIDRVYSVYYASGALYITRPGSTAELRGQDIEAGAQIVITATWPVVGKYSRDWQIG